jgi:uncharacterized protein YjiS (DUF1127 family)
MVRGLSPVEPLREPERWRLPQDFDPARIEAEAQLYRSEAMAGYAVALRRALAGLWRRAVAAPFARWQAAERAMRELARLSDRELAELGISRGLIPYVAAGKFNPRDEAAPRAAPPANENIGSQRAA